MLNNSNNYLKVKKNLSPNATENLMQWIENAKYKEFWPELEDKIKLEDWPELEDAFFKILEFGTAGRRGKVGAGSNRINSITIGESVQALCDFLNQSLSTDREKTIAIAHDTRTSSRELSELAARVAAANGYTALLFDSARSTPELSFAVRYQKCAAGIVISASHNPPEDNGIKIYSSDGGQIAFPDDKKLMDVARDIDKYNLIDFKKGLENGQIKLIGQEVDRPYIEANINLTLSTQRKLKIVYSPLHGVGMTNLYPTLLEAGFKDIVLVEEQVEQDGNFTTVPDRKPNPENLSANLLTIEKLKSEHGDIAFTTDPDADRICVMSLEKNGQVRVFSGNESAILAASYLLEKHSKKSDLSDKFIAKSVVASDALNALAEKYRINIYDNMLVGFKYIARTILEKETVKEEFIAGFEESLGQLVGDQTRDKDAATGALVLAELAAELKLENKTLAERLVEIYQEIGFFYEKSVAIDFPGAKGFSNMNKLMQKIRSGEVDFGQTANLDYKTLKRHDLVMNTETDIDCLESGNVMAFEFDNDHRRRATVRPSGTEPKLKVYLQWHSGDKPLPATEFEAILDDIKTKIGV